MHSFVYNIPVKVYFGQNQLGHLGEELKKYGTRVLMTYGGGSIKRSGLYDTIVAEIKQAGLELVELFRYRTESPHRYCKRRRQNLQGKGN